MTDRGFVLVNVLILVAALSVVAVGLLQITSRATQRLDTAQSAAQAPLMIDAGVTFAARLLAQDGTANEVDHNEEAWRLEGFIVETAIAPVRVTVVDLESRINLNRPLAPEGEVLRPAVQEMIARLDESGAWVRAAEAFYAQSGPAQAAPAMQDAEVTFETGDLTHLGGLRGPTERDTPVAEDITNIFAALPRDRGINVNTASDTVLAALPGMTPDVLAALNAARQSQPVADDAALMALLQQIAPDQTAVWSALLETQSFWFEVRSETQLNGLSYQGRTILSRNPTQRDVEVHLHVLEIDG